MQTVMIEHENENQRADKFLKRFLPAAASGFLYKMIRKKNITLNGKKMSGNELLHKGDQLSFFFSDETFQKFRGEENVNALSSSKLEEYRQYYLQNQSLSKIILETKDLLIINKPAGTLSQKDEEGGYSLNEWVLGYLFYGKKISKDSFAFFKPSVGNRLDRNTSGIVLFGKTLCGSQKISELLRTHDAHKFYHLLVEGNLCGKGRIEAYLYKNQETNRVQIIDKEEWSRLPNQEKEHYQQILTEYRCICSNEQASYLEVELFTGKTHQIRASFLHIGHPIFGDPKYKTEKNRAACEKLHIKRQMLHAYKIQFPVIEDSDFCMVSGKEIFCEEPDDFLKCKNYFFNEEKELL